MTKQDIYNEIDNHPNGVWQLGKDKTEAERLNAYNYISSIFTKYGVITPYFKKCSLDEAYAYCIGYGAFNLIGIKS